MLVTKELIEKMLGKEAPAGRGGDPPVQGATLVTSRRFLATVHLEFCECGLGKRRKPQKCWLSKSGDPFILYLTKSYLYFVPDLFKGY